MERSNRVRYLYAGLVLLALALLLSNLLPRVLYLAMLFVAIALKALFLFLTLKSARFRFPWGLRAIVAGVVMMLVASLVKRCELPEWIYQLLFYGAISLKSVGLLMTIKRDSR